MWAVRWLLWPSVDFNAALFCGCYWSTKGCRMYPQIPAPHSFNASVTSQLHHPSLGQMKASLRFITQLQTNTRGTVLTKSQIHSVHHIKTLGELLCFPWLIGNKQFHVGNGNTLVKRTWRQFHDVKLLLRGLSLINAHRKRDRRE